MSDDEEPRRPDETSESSPFDDEGESRPNDGPRTGDEVADSTEEMPRTAPDGDADRTEQMPRTAPDGDADRTEQMPRTAPDDDATQESPRPSRGDTTWELPATDDSAARTERYDRDADTWADDGGLAWSGRAGVRPRAGYEDDDWASVSPDGPDGKWWMPILVGIIALLLLGLLGWGIYLIVQSTGDDAGTPAGGDRLGRSAADRRADDAGAHHEAGHHRADAFGGAVADRHHGSGVEGALHRRGARRAGPQAVELSPAVRDKRFSARHRDRQRPGRGPAGTGGHGDRADHRGRADHVADPPTQAETTSGGPAGQQGED
nr:hypothetical protein GCM10020092_001740 [Actinoplanes digitatis]